MSSMLSPPASLAPITVSAFAPLLAPCLASFHRRSISQTRWVGSPRPRVRRTPAEASSPARSTPQRDLGSIAGGGATSSTLGLGARIGLTPLFWTHVAPYGEVKLDMSSRLALGGVTGGLG